MKRKFGIDREAFICSEINGMNGFLDCLNLCTKDHFLKQHFKMKQLLRCLIFYPKHIPWMLLWKPKDELLLNKVNKIPNMSSANVLCLRSLLHAIKLLAQCATQVCVSGNSKSQKETWHQASILPEQSIVQVIITGLEGGDARVWFRLTRELCCQVEWHHPMPFGNIGCLPKLLLWLQCYSWNPNRTHA